MKILLTKIRVVILVLAIMDLTMACALFSIVQGGKITTTTSSVEPANATTVQATIQMGFGELQVSGGSKSLMEGEFKFNVSDFQPTVDYVVSGTTGTLSIIQPNVQGLPSNVTNQWNVKLSNQMPLDLTVQTGAAKSELNIGDLMLSQLNVDAGAGETTIDLTSVKDRDISVVIKTGAGAVNLRLPSAEGVSVSSQVGIGNVNASGMHKDGDRYVNDAFGKSANSITVSVESGVGAINLEVP